MAGRKATKAKGEMPEKKRAKKQKKNESDDDEPILSSEEDDLPLEEVPTAGDNDNGTQNGEGEVVSKVETDPAVIEANRKEAGRLIICGGVNWDLTGRKELPKNTKNADKLKIPQNLWGPHVWSGDVRFKEVFSSCGAAHSILISEDNKAYVCGRNDQGQLGTGNSDTVAAPTLLDTFKNHNIVYAAVGKNHTLLLNDKGVVYACGSNKMGQCGVNNQTPIISTPTKIVYNGKPIIRMACGGDFSLIVDVDGGLYSFGSPEYGQLGHNSEGKFFTTGNKIAFNCENKPRKVAVFIEKDKQGHIVPLDDVQIVEVAAGMNHCLAVDRKKRLFSWGFGGYGRLGHSAPKDEYMPRNIKHFDYTRRGAVKVICGASSSLAVDEANLLYFWGQTKSSGEATMYPKNVSDLAGWTIRDVGHGNRSIIVAADQSVVSWGPSPTFGELGYGESKAKSSTVPQEVKTLTGIFIKKVKMGHGHSIMIAKDDEPEELEKIMKLPKWPAVPLST